MRRIYIPAQAPTDWQYLLADPGKPWRAGYSAWALAHCWQESYGYPQSVQRVFKASGIPIFEAFDPLVVFPEQAVALPGGGRPSQNDAWVLGRSGEDLVSVAVEGKVSEPFGPTVGDWLVAASEGERLRLKYLRELLGLTAAVPVSIRYQLLQRAASAVIEADRFNARHALMLVHSFSQTREGFEDYARFMVLFGAAAHPESIVPAADLGAISLYCGWVTGEERYLNA
jgi:hypothetical protein